MIELVEALAPAKVNLSLRVAAADAGGKHPLRSLAQSIGWYDRLVVERADADELEVVGADLPTDEDNLVWRAIEALRAAGAPQEPVTVRLTKRLPVAAGVGGGSSDAAAALLAYAHLVGYGDPLDTVAAGIGSDVPFCLAGGTQWMEGHGERLTPVAQPFDDYWLVLAVPPFELATAAVYRMWDELDGPSGPELPMPATPPSLRQFAPLINDLYPAAVRCKPDVADWADDLTDRWGRPVMLSGSGPTLFGYFGDADEAREAVQVVPHQARAIAAAAPTGRGAHLDDR